MTGCDVCPGGCKKGGDDHGGGGDDKKKTTVSINVGGAGIGVMSLLVGSVQS